MYELSSGYLRGIFGIKGVFIYIHKISGYKGIINNVNMQIFWQKL